MDFGIIPLCERAFTTDPKWVGEFVTMLESEDVESVWMPEHVVMAEDYGPLYEYSEDGRAPVAPTTMMPDPLHWLTFAAALTQKLVIGTGVLIGPQHSAAVLAKRLSTLDALSAGRLKVGIGIGWQKEEYEAVGVPYRQRGKRLDEALDAMRILWRDDPATYHGEFIDFEKVHCDTKPVQVGGVPFYIGGSSEAAAKRAGQRGDGFRFNGEKKKLAKLIGSKRGKGKSKGLNLYVVAAEDFVLPFGKHRLNDLVDALG